MKQIHKSSSIQTEESKIASAPLQSSNNKIITEKSSFSYNPSNILSKNLPPAIKQWANGIYSFNKNYTKTLPVVDKVVNKIIRSFFSLNPLANNPGGKKSRLIQRRFKRLSLNRIFVSKPEIKHSNNKVSITVYLFNKKKISLQSKLKDLYNENAFKPQVSASATKKGRRVRDAIRALFSASRYNAKRKGFGKKNKLGLSLGRRTFRSTGFLMKKTKHYVAAGWSAPWLFLNHKNTIGKSNSLYRLLLNSSKIRNYRVYLSKVRIPKSYRKNHSKYKKRLVYKNFYNKYIYKFKGQLGFRKNKFSGLLRKKIVKYKRVSLLTKVKMNRFISIINNRSHSSILTSTILKKSYNKIPRNLDFGILLKNKPLSFGTLSIPSFSRSGAMLTNYYFALNKYKLYNGVNPYFVYKHKPVGIAQKQEIQDNSDNNNFLPTILSTSLALQKPLTKPTIPINSIYRYLKIRQRYMLSLYEDTSTPFIVDEDKTKKASRTLVKRGNFIVRKRQNSLQKVSALYKLFTAYSNIDFYQDKALAREQVDFSNHSMETNDSTSATNKSLSTLSLVSNKFIWNTYKLLKKSFTYITLPITIEKSTSKRFGDKKTKSKITTNDFDLHKEPQRIIRKPIKNILSILREYNSVTKKKNTLKKQKRTKKFILKTRKLLLSKVKGKKISRIYIKRNLRNLMLLQKLNKITRFFKKYKKVLYKKNTVLSSINKNKDIIVSDNNGLLPVSQDPLKRALTSSENNIVLHYKLNYISDILNKDILYLYYLKMLSFNTNLFKNWFIHGLKNIVSKIYNKKVILTLVNLKYIHLNSDIFTQAIVVRLRNFKKNRLNKVLRKALNLIVLSKLNIYSYDIHSPANKFIESYYGKFTSLPKDIFNNGEENGTNRAIDNTLNENVHYRYSPKLIKGLTSVQSSTINFIRHKSVFGVRLEAAGRLTKRSTASRAIFKIRYKGNLRNNVALNRKDTSTMIKDQRLSNLQFTKISSKTRNGSFGLKGWLNNN